MSHQPDSLTLMAPAKVNLYLEVTGRRANGYHDLRSVVAPVSLCDEVTLVRTDGPIETRIARADAVGGDGLTALASADNLATRAAEALRRVTGHAGGAAITLVKRIPVGGGMGGGSADAAAVLRGLNVLWGLGLDAAALGEIGFGLGCDVPVLVRGGAVLMEGLGERLTPLTLTEARPAPAGGTPGWWLVLANAGFGVPTRDVYRRHRLSLTSGDETLTNLVLALKDGDVTRAAGCLFNSLEATVYRKYPLLKQMARALARAGAAGGLLSGSGGTLFGLCDGRDRARAVAARAREALGAGVWIDVVRLLPDGVTAAHGPLEARV